VATGSAPTGCAFITVDAAGENAITVASGANADLSASALPDDAVVAGMTLVLQMEVPFAASLEAAKRVRAAGGRVVWNLAPVPGRLTAGDLDTVLAATDVLVVNEHEARAAARLRGLADDGLDALAQALAASGALTCVVTAGARGAIAVEPDGARHAAAPAPIRPVDTTGAGDTFVGILAAGLDEGRPLREALARACRGASLACMAEGAQTGMPTSNLLA
jgi:ribokinase